MAGRYAKNSGATMKLADRTEAKQLRRFVPDFYVRSRPPVPQPNFRPRLNQTFGKRIVDQTAKGLLRRSPLAALGPLGDLLALGLITKDLYDLMMELQRQRHEYRVNGEPVMSEYIQGDPVPYDLSQWYNNGPDPDPNSPWVIPSQPWHQLISTEGETIRFGYGGPTPWGNVVPIGNWGAPDALYDPSWMTGSPDATTNYIRYRWAHCQFDDDPNTDFIRVGTNYWYVGDPVVTYTGEWTYGLAIPLPWDIPFDWTEPDPNMKRNMFPDGKTLDPDMAPKPETEPEMKRARRFRKKVRLKERDVRERKGKTGLTRLLHIMDIASEGAELIDAVYESLPDDTRKHWEEMQGAHWAFYDGKYHWVIPSRGLLDSGGQYGIDGADWKARAIWHNWHKIDIDRAVKNIIRNEIQDRILGGIAGASPANVGHTTDAANKQINKWLEDLFEEVGL